MAIITVGFNPAIDRILECPGFRAGAHQQARLIARLAAGKSVNVSRVLAQLGMDSTAAGFVGGDEHAFFRTQLIAVGPGRVHCAFTEVSGHTRENISVVDPLTSVDTHLRDRGFTVTPAKAAALAQQLTDSVTTGDIVVFAGYLAEGMRAEYLGELMDLAIEEGARVVADTSGEPLRIAVSRPAWVLKPNLDEVRELFGDRVADEPAALADAVRPLLERAEHVIITRSGAGAVLVTRHGAWSGCVAQHAPVVRTVGCGDHLLAGFIAELVAGRMPLDALRTGLAVATARAVSHDMARFDPEAMTAAARSVGIESL